MRQEDLKLLWVLIGVFTLLIVVAFALFISDFSSGVNYIKSEIRRTTGKEKQYWQRELKAMYLSLIPGISLSRAKKIVHRKHIKL